jgi:hypothetical protein
VTDIRIDEQIVPGQRLGRHVKHDPRSLRYLVQPATVPQTKVWTRHIPVLDQGDLGSCTGNATTGVLGSEPFYDTLTSAQQQTLNEKQAVAFYSLATQLDDYPQNYPPTDTGSDGLDVAKAAQQLGYISGYLHITSVAAAQTAILAGPFIVGTNWMSGMDNPDPSGRVHATGSVRGGHEYQCIGYHADTDLWEFVNSWGSGWGLGGRFLYSSADFAKLLAADGDATTFVPITQPAPAPAPTPEPSNAFPAAAYEAWHAHQHSVPKTNAMRDAIDAWLGRA